MCIFIINIYLIAVFILKDLCHCIEWPMSQVCFDYITSGMLIYAIYIIILYHIIMLHVYH